MKMNFDDVCKPENDGFVRCRMRFHTARVLYEDLQEEKSGDLGYPVTDHFNEWIEWIYPIILEWFEEDNEDCFRCLSMIMKKVCSNLLFSKNWGQAFTGRPDSPDFVDEYNDDANDVFCFEKNAVTDEPNTDTEEKADTELPADG
jgi:hypothetical protein